MQKFHIAIWYAQPSYAPPSSSTFALIPHLPTSIALNQVPPARQLQHIIQFSEPLVPTNALHNPNSVTQICCPVLLGRQIPPISPKLVKKTIEGQYVDMAQLRPEHLEALNAADEDHSKFSQSGPKEISNILDWVQAFCIYVHSQKTNHIVFQVSWCIIVLGGILV